MRSLPSTATRSYTSTASPAASTRTLPVLSLPRLLGTEGQANGIARLLVTEADKEPVALQVDGFEQRIDALVRERSGLLSGVPGVMGTALMGDGGVLLVLDLPELVR